MNQQLDFSISSIFEEYRLRGLNEDNQIVPTAEDVVLESLVMEENAGKSLSIFKVLPKKREQWNK